MPFSAICVKLFMVDLVIIRKFLHLFNVIMLILLNRTEVIWFDLGLKFVNFENKNVLLSMSLLRL
jgi:hypothetical protein